MFANVTVLHLKCPQFPYFSVQFRKSFHPFVIKTKSEHSYQMHRIALVRIGLNFISLRFIFMRADAVQCETFYYYYMFSL